MSARRRREHRDLVLYRQMWAALRRDFDAMRSKGTGPFAPGPWWPKGHPKHLPEPR